MTVRHRLAALAAGAALGVLQPMGAHAQTRVDLSGFASVVGGKVLGGSLHGDLPSNPDIRCPCYVADWANFGTYGPSATLRAETRAGMQATVTFDPTFSAAAQVTARAVDGKAQLQWAYATIALGSTWDLQVGRKRIPLYHYSSFQDVGMAYPWVSPPPELYGWEATNYNGFSLRNRSTWGDVYLNASVFAGSERVRDSRFMLAYGETRTDARWQGIRGADVELTKGILTVRAVYLQADTSFTDKNDTVNDYSEDMRAYGLSANLDFNRWFVLTEVATNVRSNKTGYLAGVTLRIPAYSVGAGMRLGAWTPFINYAHYREKSSDLVLYAPYVYSHASMTLRYELSTTAAVKVQFDRLREPADPFTGGAQVFRVAYDRVF